MNKSHLMGAVCASFFSAGLSSAAYSATLSFATSTLDNYLLVSQTSLDNSLDINSSLEIGAYSSSYPGSPTAITSPGVSPIVGITYDGNVAITDTSGTVTMQDINVYADTGIECASSYNNCTDSGAKFSTTAYDDASGGTGLTPIGEGNGVTGNVDFTGLNTEISDAATAIGAYTTFDQLISTDGGTIDTDTVITLTSGLNIIGFGDTSGGSLSPLSGSDVSLDTANLIFQGASDATAIIILPDDSNFISSNGNLLIGDGGVGLNNVLLASLTNDNDTHFSFSNSIINGVALYDLGGGDGIVNFSNVGGCTQVVGDKLTFNNVSLSQCGFSSTVVPIPAAAWLFSSGLIGLVGIARRKKA